MIERTRRLSCGHEAKDDAGHDYVFVTHSVLLLYCDAQLLPFVAEDPAGRGERFGGREVERTKILVHFASDALQEMILVTHWGFTLHAGIVFRLLEGNRGIFMIT